MSPLVGTLAFSRWLVVLLRLYIYIYIYIYILLLNSTLPTVIATKVPPAELPGGVNAGNSATSGAAGRLKLWLLSAKKNTSLLALTKARRRPEILAQEKLAAGPGFRVVRISPESLTPEHY